MPELYWLAPATDWNDRLRAAKVAKSVAPDALVSLAAARLDFVQTNRLDKIAQRHGAVLAALPAKAVRLAVLGSSTMDHLLPAIRIGGLRRSIAIDTYAADYGNYRHELMDPSSALHEFRPTALLFALDQRHLLGAAHAGRSAAEADALLDTVSDRIRGFWRLARERSTAAIIQQTVLPVYPALAGSNEHRLPGSPLHLVQRLNERLRRLADAEGVDILGLDARAAEDGLLAWHDPVLWHRAKQEISPVAAPVYGDLVGRLLAAQQGRSAKCLVLDLDNTLWGGVIGDDGMEGIVLGQGSALGEAFVAFQDYARELSRRGVILAVCSKNDEANALQPFDAHPDMVLRRGDIACFIANWQDKAANLRHIAETLSIGIDSLVFVDDNPFERNIVRRELPMVAVPEIPEDPALWPLCLADAGYFEAVRITEEDVSRSGQYQANLQRESLKASATDMAGYLASLEMELRWGPFDTLNLTRIVQLINKTNQFNLMTRRYGDAEIREILREPGVVTLQLRLLDRFGDNGIIGIVIARMADAAVGDMVIDTWLMSCRVLGRQVEEATLNLLVQEAKAAGAERLIGQYRPTAKNKMVEAHYPKLGFAPAEPDAEGTRSWTLALAGFTGYDTSMTMTRL
jgi:FkbH-like protein